MNTIDESKVKKCADYVRYLALESIERAKSGHPGIALGCAEIGVLLYRYLLKNNPGQPSWLNRDRFILSAGHGSILLYSLLYIGGYPITLEDLGKFRQLGSITPGHPEYNLNLGIETTTGPLGQGFANAVGCALEGKILADRFNEKDCEIVDYTVFTLMGDGCNMEGISYEAASLAGHLALDNLIAIYDANDISIDGHMNLTFSDDITNRYQGLGWHVEHSDITNPTDVFNKLNQLKAMKGKPKILVVKTTIGQGLNKKKDTPGIHGSPAGNEEIAYFIQHAPSIKALFQEKYEKNEVEDSVKLSEIVNNRITTKPSLLESPNCLSFMQENIKAKEESYSQWLKKLDDYKEKYPEKHTAFSKYTQFELPASLEQELLNFSLYKKIEDIKPEAVRGISGKVLNLCANEIPQLLGGSADLTDSTKAKINDGAPISKENYSGRKIYFGVREHAMGAISNGLALNKTSIPFCSTFFTFFDYMKPAVRMAALMKLNHIFIFSHDSIYVGEDGPTHQPIEHLNSLRLIPNMYTFRPANDMETAFAFLYFLQKMDGPIAIITTRQKLPKEVFELHMRSALSREDRFVQFKKGAYTFYQTTMDKKPDIVLAASGSEVALALQTAKLIEAKDNQTLRVVSIPCLDLLNETTQTYREDLFLGTETPLVLIEAASHRGMHLFYDQRTILVDIETFGESAPDSAVASHFGYTPEAIYERIKSAKTSV